MFSHEPRCIYRSNQLAEVICQLRFPKIPTIPTKVPEEFFKVMAEDFPQYSCRKEIPNGVSPSKPEEHVTNHQFISDDGIWKINLTENFIALSCRRYTRWEDFASHLDRPLVAFIQACKPQYFERVGLRYLNFVSRNALQLSHIPYSRLFTPCYLGLLADEDVPETSTTRCSMDTEVKLPGGSRVNIHAGPGMIKLGNTDEREVKYIFDQDVYMPGNVPVNRCADTLEGLHKQAFSIFRGAITNILHDAMEPEFI